jgi:hypothetical protein
MGTLITLVSLVEYSDLIFFAMKFFRAWQDMLMGPADNPTGAYLKSSSTYKNRHRAFSQYYYDEYTYGVIINKLEKYGTKPGEDYREDFGFRLENAYPYTISSVPYSAGPAQLVKVTVGMYYEYSSMYINN